ncbi:MAG: hypothetical protein M0Z94_14910 [Dehalococcoidales bacterium]|nr:hypothetical protein [Dehalococcoidales bacterium]
MRFGSGYEPEVGVGGCVGSGVALATVGTLGSVPVGGLTGGIG